MQRNGGPAAEWGRLIRAHLQILQQGPKRSDKQAHQHSTARCACEARHLAVTALPLPAISHSPQEGLTPVA